MAGTWDVTVVAVLRNEAPYVEEWIAYHHVVGVDHFVLYDNDSDDDIRTVLRRYITHGLVTLIDFPMVGAQVPAYRHAVHCFGGATRWLAPIDLDEFIVPKVDADLPAMLRRLGDVDRVVLPWRNFGMSGHRVRPAGLVIEEFTRAEDVPDSGFARMAIKSIARSSAITSMGVHSQLVPPGRTVDAEGEVPELDRVQLIRPRFVGGQINHYVTKSEAELRAKRARGASNRNLPRPVHLAAEEVGFSTPDHSIARFVEPTRRRLAQHRALPPTPYRFGSQVGMRLAHQDPFLDDAGLTVSNYLHGMQVPRNGTNPVPNVARTEDRTWVSRVEERHRGPARWTLGDSPHLADLVRRFVSTVGWSLGAPTPLTDGGLTVDVGTDGTARHLAVAGVVRADAGTVIRWSAHAAGAHVGHVDTPLPEAGRYVVVAEANRLAAPCDRLGVEVLDPSSVTVDELHVLAYG